MPESKSDVLPIHYIPIGSQPELHRSRCGRSGFYGTPDIYFHERGSGWNRTSVSASCKRGGQSRAGALYLLSYGAMCLGWSQHPRRAGLSRLSGRRFPHAMVGFPRWSCWRESNPRPADYKSAALASELQQHRAPCTTGPIAMQDFSSFRAVIYKGEKGSDRPGLPTGAGARRR